MEITVNQQNLDFTLELENTLGEVYRELTKWFEPSGYIITHMEGDSEEYNLDEPAAWNDTSIEDVTVLDLTVLSPLESAHSRGEFWAIATAGRTTSRTMASEAKK